MGERLGYAPSIDEELLPRNTLQSIFTNNYGLKKYFPTILQPSKFDYKNKIAPPVYYSLQNPPTFIFSPKSTEAATTLLELRELIRIVNIMISAFQKPGKIYSNEVLARTYPLTNEIDLNYFHNRPGHEKHIQKSSLLASLDPRFKDTSTLCQLDSAIVATSSSFMRGCISIEHKNRSS